MAESPTLVRDLELRQSEDFYLLREKGIEFVQLLGNKLWTDYNLHDPGITILELFCYALTDLGYRTGHLMKDLLTRQIDGIPVSLGDFHTAREIFSCNPVTFDDIRKMLVDIRGVRNAWVLPFRELSYDLLNVKPPRLLMPFEASTIETAALKEGIESPIVCTPPINGLYQVLLEYEEFITELKTGVDNIACVRGNYIPPEGKGITFEVFGDLLIREVSIYAASEEAFKIHLLDSKGKSIWTFEHTPTKVFRKDYVSLNLPISYAAGGDNIYHLVVEGDLPRLYAHQTDSYEGFHLEDYVRLLGGYVPGERAPTLDYHFFYDWEIEMPEVFGELMLTQREEVGLANSAKFSGKVVLPQGEGIVFDANCPLKLESFCISYMGLGDVNIVLYDETGKDIASTIFSPEEEAKSPTTEEIFVNWEIPACQGYRLTANSDSVELFMNEEAEFPYLIPGVIILLGSEENGGLSQQYNYFYNWVVSFQQKSAPNLADEELTSAHVKEEVRRRLREHRNLCEDLIKVKAIEEEEIGLYADIEFDGEDVEDLLAEIYCIMEEYVKPPVRFYTWQQLIEKGYTADEVFSGPLMDHGFIDPKEFEGTRRKEDLRVSDIVQLIMNIPSVKKVKNIYVTSFIDGRLAKKEPWILCLEKDDCLVANFNPDRSGLSIYRDGIPYQCDHTRVEELLLEKSLRNRAVKLKGHELDCAVPVGEDQLLEDFYPMQNDLPITYLVGENQVPDSATDLRHAQSRQLKAYLMFFEQILANFLSQLNHLPELFSWDLASNDRDQISTYFTQRVEEIVDLPEIYKDYENLEEDLEEIIEKPESARDRKNKFLDHLLARFAEDFSTYSTLMYALFTNRKEAALRMIEDKQLFLQHYPDVSRNRGQGINFTYRKDLPVLSGFQRRICRKLGMYHRENVNLDDLTIQAFREKGEGWFFHVVDENGKILFKSIYVPDRDTLDNLIDLAVFAGKDKANFVLSSSLPGCDEGKWTLLAPCGKMEERQIIGNVIGEEEAILDQLVYLFAHYQRPIGYSQPADLQYKPLTNDCFEIVSEDPDPEGPDEGPWHFLIKIEIGGEKREVFRSKTCKSRFFVEELLEQTFKVGTYWDYYSLDKEKCVWNLYACPGDEDSLIGSTTNLLSRKSLIDILDKACNTEGMHLIEHILLRPRLASDGFLNVRFKKFDIENANIADETGKRILLVDPYSFRMTLVLPAWSKRFRNLQFRRFVEDLIRLEAPAHVYVNIYWVSYTQMQAFEPIYLKWLQELGKLPVQLNGMHPLPDDSSFDDYHYALQALLEMMENLKNIFPQAQLYDPASQETGDTQPTLGNMSLGQI